MVSALQINSLKTFPLPPCQAVNGDELTVDFPEHSGWTGMISEMELEPTDDTGDPIFFNFT